VADTPLTAQPPRIRPVLKNIAMATLKGAGGAIGSVIKEELITATGQFGAGFGAAYSNARKDQSKLAEKERNSAIKAANLSGNNAKAAKSAAATAKTGDITEALKKQSVFNENMVQQTKILADSIVSIDQRVSNIEIGQRNIQNDINRIMFMLEEIKGSRPNNAVAGDNTTQKPQGQGEGGGSFLSSVLSTAAGVALAPVIARIGASLIAATPALIAALPYVIAAGLMGHGLDKLTTSIMQDPDFQKSAERTKAQGLTPEDERKKVVQESVQNRNNPAYREEVTDKRESALKKNNAKASDVARSISNYIVLKDGRTIDINTGEEVDKSMALDEQGRAQIDPSKTISTTGRTRRGAANIQGPESSSGTVPESGTPVTTPSAVIPAAAPVMNTENATRIEQLKKEYKEAKAREEAAKEEIKKFESEQEASGVKKTKFSKIAEYYGGDGPDEYADPETQKKYKELRSGLYEANKSARSSRAIEEEAGTRLALGKNDLGTDIEGRKRNPESQTGIGNDISDIEPIIKVLKTQFGMTEKELQSYGGGASASSMIRIGTKTYSMSIIGLYKQKIKELLSSGEAISKDQGSGVNATPVGSESVTDIRPSTTSTEATMTGQEQQRQAATLAEQKDLSVRGNEIDINSKTELNLSGRSIKIEGTGAQTILFKSPNIRFEADKLEFVYSEKIEKKVAAAAGKDGATPGGDASTNTGGGATPVGDGSSVTPSGAGSAETPSNTGGAGSATTPGGAPVTTTTGTNKQILDTIKKRESGNNYLARAKGSTASGAYQFINGTWKSLTKKFNIGTEFASAADAPPAIQDKVADAYISDILRRANGDVSKVPLEWYTGNISGKISAAAMAANRGLTPQAYQSSWMAEYARQGGKIQRSQSSATPTTGSGASVTPAAATTGGAGESPDASPAGAAQSGATAPAAPAAGAAGGIGGEDSESGNGAAMGAGASTTTPGGEGSAATPGGGGNITQAQSGTRRLPISNKLSSVLSSAARAAGVDVTVTSGGQPAFPKGPRVGSTRHDLGNAADLDLRAGGRILTDANPADVAIKKKFVAAAAAAGASGIGAGMGYMGPTKIHVGFGKPAKWGGAPWLSGVTPGSGSAGEPTPSSGAAGSSATPAAPASSASGGGPRAAVSEEAPAGQMAMAQPDSGSSLNERSSTAEVDTRIGNMKTPQNQTPPTQVIDNNVQQTAGRNSNQGQGQDQQSMGSFMAAPDESYFSSTGFTSVTPDPAFYGPGGKSSFSAGRLG